MNQEAEQAGEAERIFDVALRPLQAELSDKSINEIMVNRPGEVWIEKAGSMHKLERPIGNSEILSAAKMLGSMMRRDVNDRGGKESILDAHFRGLRVAVVLNPVALDGHAISIRRHSERLIPLEHYVEDAMRSEGVGVDKGRADYLDGAPLGRWLESLFERPVNVIISGGTSSGKTTLFNSLLSRVPDHERVITIEDTAELRVTNPNTVRLESNNDKEVTARLLLKLSLRMRPDRIFVGEVRGGEAYDMLQAMNTGHSGACTVHANGAREALSRLETLVLTSGVNWPHQAIQANIAETIDYIIQVSRRADGSRGITEIVSIIGFGQDGYRVKRLWPRQVSTQPVIGN